MKKQKHTKYKTISMKLYNTKIYKHFFFILVCEMEAMELIFLKNGTGYCDYKWVKRFVRLIYSCTDLKICRFRCKGGTLDHTKERYVRFRLAIGDINY